MVVEDRFVSEHEIQPAVRGTLQDIDVWQPCHGNAGDLGIRVTGHDAVDFFLGCMRWRLAGQKLVKIDCAHFRFSVGPTLWCQS